MSALDEANNRNGDLLTEISRLQQENAKLRARLNGWLAWDAEAADAPQPVRDALREMLVGTRCESIGGLEDLEPGCCRVCRARAALYTAQPRPDVGSELPAAARDNEITFWYKNHRGENAIRFARILGLRWGTNDYYTEEQWLLHAYDYDRHAEREFAVKDMSPITADRARAADRSEK